MRHSKPYVVVGRAEDLRERPSEYILLLARPLETVIPRVLRILDVSYQSLFLYHLDTKKMYNTLTLTEVSDLDS